MQIEGERLSDMPDGLHQQLWVTKFTSWKALKESCVAQRGPAGIYCLWIGQNCSYKSCPRRIFEEVMVDMSKVQVKPGKLNKVVQQQAEQIKQLQDQNGQQTSMIKSLQKEINELKKVGV